MLNLLSISTLSPPPRKGRDSVRGTTRGAKPRTTEGIRRAARQGTRQETTLVLYLWKISEAKWVR